MKSLLHAVFSGLILGVTILIVNDLMIKEHSSKFSYSLFQNNNAPANYTQAIEASAPAVVNIFIQITDSDYDGSKSDSTSSTRNLGSASGIIVNKDGYILTNYHVIMNASVVGSTIFVQLRNGKTYQASIIGYDKRTDIAVLKVSTKDVLPVIPINLKRKPRLGDVVLAIGNPYNIGQTITMGIISAVGRSGSGVTNLNTLDLSPGLQEFIQTDAAINSGNSGGALVNSLGEFVGMNTATLSSIEAQTNSISFAIPADLSLNIMNDIIKHGRVIRGYLGITAKDISADQAGYKNKSGIIVTSIDPAGPATNLLRTGDIITAINGIKVNNLKQVMNIIASSMPNTSLTFSLIRGDEILETSVLLAEQN
ncbi:serine protease DegS [Ruminobacter amylophilus]|uniref:Serine protease DegS n=1 Tax=Ruminobacter amylophilus TaxID=867 RepID=A0A662ZGZ5_9GAMM|nr:trypsin-like peptidase domain-containing protein [Ruminobacter amylophilus]SFP34705.1 serine protease DegS [Ruminobacter amylophilus]